MSLSCCFSAEQHESFCVLRMSSAVGTSSRSRRRRTSAQTNAASCAAWTDRDVRICCRRPRRQTVSLRCAFACGTLASSTSETSFRIRGRETVSRECAAPLCGTLALTAGGTADRSRCSGTVFLRCACGCAPRGWPWDGSRCRSGCTWTASRSSERRCVAGGRPSTGTPAHRWHRCAFSGVCLKLVQG